MHQEIEVFLYPETGRARAIKVIQGETVLEVLGRAGIPKDEHLLAFLGECKDGLSDGVLDGGEDSHEPCATEASVESLGVIRGASITCHRCRRVAVEIHYQSRTRRRRFSPATTIAVVTAWARRAFQLIDPDAEKLVLHICNSDEQPRPTQRLGQLVSAPNCAVCFTLVPEKKIEG